MKQEQNKDKEDSFQLSQNSEDQQSNHLRLSLFKKITNRLFNQNTIILLLLMILMISLGVFLADNQIIQSNADQIIQITPSNSKILRHQLVKVKQKQQIVAVDKRNQQIYHYTCDDVQPMFHYYHLDTQSLHYRTSYGIFFQVTQLGRLSFQVWNLRRQIIEWGRKNIKRGDKVFYDCPNQENLLEIVMLSKFIGPTGTLVINKVHKQRAFQSLNKFYNIKNVQKIFDQNPNYQNYSFIITTNEIQFKKIMSSNLLEEKQSYKILALLENIIKIPQFTQKMSYIKQLKFSQISLDDSSCNNKLFSKKAKEKPGFYEFKKEKKSSQSNNFVEQQMKYIQSPFIQMLEKEYQSFKAKKPQLNQKKDINAIMSNLPVHSSKIVDVTKEKLSEWQNQKEIIQWVKNITIYSSNIYYQYNPDSLNLLAVLNIGVLLEKGQVQVVCTEKEWLILQKNAKILNLTSIKYLPQSSLQKAIQSNFIITDNINIIEYSLKSNFTDKGKILGYFSQKTPTSVNTLYAAYVKNHVRKVMIKPSFYYGYQVFDHFVWHSNHPEGFFEIQKLNYVIFTYWGDQPEKIVKNRRFNLEESIQVNGVQLKLIYPKLLPFFVLKDLPLHKAFQYLTPVHKSDYIRPYLMYHYGGGYHDIKHIHFNWREHFQKLQKNQTMWATGYHERHPQWPSCHQQPGQIPCNQIKKHYLNIMGAGQYIHKKQSPLTSYWMRRVHQILDQKYELLKITPYLDPRDCLGREHLINGQRVISQYPLRWQQINAQIFCRAQYSVLGQYYVDLPYVITIDYF